MSFDAVAYINEPRWQKSRLGLERMFDLLARLGNPQDDVRFVHVAGTNGKGSVCAYVARILREAGLRTGAFTSPYIETFEERIRVDGQNISHPDLKRATLLVREKAEEQFEQTGEHATEFELMWAVALVHFRAQKCDIVVAEVGLGGRLDATNTITHPEVCVIARIGLDHTELLGDTLAKVAAEKAGIIKRGVAVVSATQDAPAEQVIRACCARLDCSLEFVDDTQLIYKGYKHDGDIYEQMFVYQDVPYTTRLLGSYQPSNAALAIECCKALRARGWNIADDAFARGIAHAQWPGRFELLSRGGDSFAFIVDGAHNPQGAIALVESLRRMFGEAETQAGVLFIMGVLADKDYPAMVRALAPLMGACYTIVPDSPRALSASDLARTVELETGADVPVCACGNIEEAVSSALAEADGFAVVVACGSLYAIASIKRAYEACLSRP